MNFRLLASALTGAFLLAAGASAHAQGAPDQCPTGEIEVVRVSRITPNGSMAGVEKAVADHAKWYADHGFTEDRIVMAPVYIRDPATQVVTKAADQFMTVHARAHDVPRDRQDAGWAAFVAEYDANSQIITQSIVCVPR